MISMPQSQNLSRWFKILKPKGKLTYYTKVIKHQRNTYRTNDIFAEQNEGIKFKQPFELYAVYYTNELWKKIFIVALYSNSTYMALQLKFICISPSETVQILERMKALHQRDLARVLGSRKYAVEEHILRKIYIE